MKIEIINNNDKLWNILIKYAKECSWAAGPTLSKWMKDKKFKDFERVIVAYEEDIICGYCTVTKEDCIPDVSYTPYIGFVYVDVNYRGNRLSEKMIDFACGYIKSIGFDKAYLTSDHENLYEKYGFKVIDTKKAYWGSLEKIYMKEL